ncbi:MAG: hypothetical protein CMK07_11575 [Ponticaulis sp.]|nr:hypothetical protein [Ponticaulis sp.]
MKVIIHAGMHKTGSSSIQRTLAEAKLTDHTYAPWEKPNHSSLFQLLFRDPVEDYRGFKIEGLTRANLLAKRTEWLTRNTATLEENAAKTIVYSGEDLSSRHDFGITEKFAAYLRQFTQNIEVICYVRPPVSFMASTLQQNVKSNNLSRLNPNKLWPYYRDRLEKFDRIFGANNVRLVKFEKSGLTNGDAVTDFLTWIGINPSDINILNTNESLSLETLALVFAQRKLTDGLAKGFKGAGRANRIAVRALSETGNTPIALAPEFYERVLKRNRQDLAWIDQRMGTSMMDTPKFSPNPIRSEDQLIDIALGLVEKLDETLPKSLSNQNTETDRRERLIRYFQLLQENAQAQLAKT